MSDLLLFGTRSCPYTRNVREDLELRGESFTEIDVEEDVEQLARMLELTGGNRMVPVLVRDGEVVRQGWRGRGCYVGQ